MENDKWIIETKDTYTIGGQSVVKTSKIAIPPTDGDRTDIIDENGKYHLGMTKSRFMKRLTPEEYLEQTLPGLGNKEKAQALKNIDWTPRERNEQIAVVIQIKGGEINLKGK